MKKHMVSDLMVYLVRDTYYGKETKHHTNKYTIINVA